MEATIRVTLIETEEQYKAAFNRMQEIFDAEPGTPEYKEIKILSILLEDYEKEHFPIEPLDPIASIKINMEKRGMKQKDLIGIIGGKSLVSQVLNRKRALTLAMVREFERLLGIPAAVLIQPYDLVK